MNLAKRTIKNKHLVMALAKRWPRDLPPPVLVSDTEAIARAKSLVVATRGHVDLTPAEARAIIAEHELVEDID